MKNLNTTTKKATMPKLSLITFVNRTFLYSLCAALFLLTCSLSTRAKSVNLRVFKANPYTLTSLGLGAIADFEKSHRALLNGTNSGYDFTNAKDEPNILGFTLPNVTSINSSAQTGSSPFINNFGDPFHSGPDEWFHIVVADGGYLDLTGGTADFDSFFYLLASDGTTVLTTGDDGAGSGIAGHSYCQPNISYYVSAGDYYLVVDGTDKFGAAVKGDMSITLRLTH
ncbi:pre-peptidase C-terminal domain-containing protein [Mucilaginibacter sp. dw_454]|uniref:pre-peptidase C-terminal domain-containing protein n=1 Tax=Mucilaginibacter sp. dw_454 TaxID=2720079 RepID=UPI001BD51ABE|nr:pre-peptidase C-terminal domain-containing protein [Mucilaginibacter sp. dw_454]